MFNLAILYVQYDPEKYGGSLDKLRSYVDRIPLCKKRYIVINNKNEGDSSREISDSVHEIGGDNTSREFSAWQKGIEFLQSNNIRCDVVLFCNDAFLANGPSYLAGHASVAFLKSLFLNRVVGRIDSTGKKHTIYDRDVSSWVCTNCFFISGRILKHIDSMISVDKNQINHFFSDEYSPDIFKEDAPINNDYKDDLKEWITTGWHDRMDINAGSWDFFKEKVRMILNEALFTANLREKGIKVSPYGKKRYY